MSTRPRGGRAFALVAVLLLSAAAVACGQAATQQSRRVLVLHSYQQGEGWVQNVTDGIRSVFEDNRDYTWNLRYEYMNVMDTDPLEYPEVFQRRFGRSRFDLVICVNDLALAFAVTNRQLFFPDVPIVFCGVDRFDPSMLRGERGITGAVGALDFAGTFTIMRRLHPRAKHLLIFANREVASERAAYERLVIAANAEFRRDVSVRYWQDPRLSDVLGRAGSFATDTVVFTLATFTDDQGRLLPLGPATLQVSDALGLPIYTCWESLLGYGVVGGSVTSGLQQGEAAATLALRILRGENPDQIPVLRGGSSHPAFDWRELGRFGIPTRALPRGSHVVNHPDTLYERFKILIWAGAAVLAALLAILAFSWAYLGTQQRLKRRIAQSEQRLAVALEATGSGIWEWDPVDNETYFDPRWFSLLGYVPGDLPSTYDTWANLLHPEDRARVEEEVRRHVAEGTDFSIEFRMRSADGQWRWIASSGAVAERNAAGAVIRMVGTHVDVTDRRAAEEAVHESARRYRFLYEKSPAISIIVDPEGSVLDINAAFLEQFGYTREQVVGRSALEFVLPEQRAVLAAQLERDVGGEATPQVEVDAVASDGSVRTILFSDSSALLREGDAVRGVLLTGIDITERKRSQERERLQADQLIQTDKLASLGILVSGVAHEINNPTNFILLNGRICSRVWTDIGPILRDYEREHGDFLLAGMPFAEAWPRIAKLMDGIHEGAQRIRKIVQSLRDFARRDPGELDQQLDPNTVVDSAVTLVRHLLDTSTERFTLDLDPAVPRIRGNFQQLEQVVINLLTNACQALADRQRGITVSSRFEQEAGRVLIEVADEGVGIPPESLRRVFDPFFTTKQDRGGTGLGLSISYTIVRNHGGELTLASGPGRGTVATVILPLAGPRENR